MGQIFTAASQGVIRRAAPAEQFVPDPVAEFQKAQNPR
jgi:hypothetical protein